MFNQTCSIFCPCTINVIINLLAIMLIYHICKYVFKHHVSYMLSAYTFFSLELIFKFWLILCQCIRNKLTYGTNDVISLESTFCVFLFNYLTFCFW